MFIPVAIVILGTLLSKGSSPKALPAKPGTRVATVTKKALAIKPGVPLLQQKAVIARVREVAMKGSAVQVAKLAGVVWKKGEATAARKLLRIAKKKARVEVNAKVSGDLIGAYNPYRGQKTGGLSDLKRVYLKLERLYHEQGLTFRGARDAAKTSMRDVGAENILSSLHAGESVSDIARSIVYGRVSGDLIGASYGPHQWLLEYQREGGRGSAGFASWLRKQAATAEPGLASRMMKYAHQASRPTVAGEEFVDAVGARQYGRPLKPMFKRRLEEKVQRLLEQQGVSHPESFHRAQALVRKQGFDIPTLQSTTAPVSEIAREIVYGRVGADDVGAAKPFVIDLTAAERQRAERRRRIREVFGDRALETHVNMRIIKNRVGADEEFEPVETFMVDAKTDTDDRPVIPEYEYPEISGCHKLQLV